MADSVSMPGDREAAAAIDAMMDTYGRPVVAGGRIAYRLDSMAATEWAAGEVVEVVGRVAVVEPDGGDGLQVPVPFRCILPF
jgi:hypothetical protein